MSRTVDEQNAGEALRNTLIELNKEPFGPSLNRLVTLLLLNAVMRHIDLKSETIRTLEEENKGLRKALEAAE